jgi:hypothetical protein
VKETNKRGNKKEKRKRGRTKKIKLAVTSLILLMYQ